MAISPLKDLPPRYDVRGGSPKTPVTGIPMQEFQQYAGPLHNGWVNKLLFATTTGLAALVIGLLIALFAALQNKGISSKDMQEYVDKYSPVLPKDIALLAGQIGELRGKQERVFERLGNLESNEKTDEKEVVEFKTEVRNNNKLVADFIEESRKAKK